MPKPVKVGKFCPNEECVEYGKLQSETDQRNIKKYGKTKAGRQRYHCKTCHKTFSETKGTMFYGRRVPEAGIIETLALLAEGSRISSLSRGKGYNEDTILDWLRAAAKRADVIEDQLLVTYQLEPGQLDALWTYVGNKGEKKIS